MVNYIKSLQEKLFFTLTCNPIMIQRQVKLNVLVIIQQASSWLHLWTGRSMWLKEDESEPRIFQRNLLNRLQKQLKLKGRVHTSLAEYLVFLGVCAILVLLHICWFIGENLCSVLSKKKAFFPWKEIAV